MKIATIFVLKLFKIYSNTYFLFLRTISSSLLARNRTDSDRTCFELDTSLIPRYLCALRCLFLPGWWDLHATRLGHPAPQMWQHRSNPRKLSVFVAILWPRFLLPVLLFLPTPPCLSDPMTLSVSIKRLTFCKNNTLKICIYQLTNVPLELFPNYWGAPDGRPIPVLDQERIPHKRVAHRISWWT